MTLNVEVRSVSQRFDAVTALDGLSLSLNGGKIHGLLGRNGSGKSTLLSVIAAFRKPTEGAVFVDGEPVFENPRKTREITLIREAGDTVEGSETVETALSYAGFMRPRWDSAYAKQLADRFELPRASRIAKLSRGQRSALGIVLGLASRSPLTMFDESYLGLDAPSRYLFYDELLADYIRHPRTIIVSTHLIEEVSSLFEEVVIIDRGRMLIHEEREQLLARGATVTGPAPQVDQFVDGHTILTSRQLGPTKAVTIFGSLSDADRTRAAQAGLELGAVALQDLFVHLTQTIGGER